MNNKNEKQAEPSMNTAMRNKCSQKRALFKNKSEKRDLQLIKVFTLKRSTESRYDDPVTAKGYGRQLSSIYKSNKQDMVGDHSTPLNLYVNNK